jgi:hypothetical protein
MVFIISKETLLFFIAPYLNPVMTSQIPACKNCNHFQACYDKMFSTCDRYQYETVDFLNGTVQKHNSLAFAMRDDEKFCGREGKNFEQRETPVVEEQMSFWQVLKEFLKNPSIF